MITSRTRLLALLGNPVGHSLSPAMQNAALRHLKIDARYLAFQVERENLPGALSGMKVLGVLGVNITVPFKEDAFHLMDRVGDEAEGLGAVNTVVFREGTATGFNTDVQGVKGALEALGCGEKSALLLGAGGAGRAAALALFQEGFLRVFVSNRHGERAEKLIRDLHTRTRGAEFRTIPWGSPPPAPFGVLVNATSLGLEGKPWPRECLQVLLDSVRNGKEKVLDMVYRSEGETELVKAARERGIPAAGGEEVLLRQGAACFRIFTGCDAPLGVMRMALGRPSGEGERA